MHLEELLAMQRRLQDHIRIAANKPLLSQLGPTALSEYILEDTYALEDELHEALAHVGWKSWAKERGIIDREAYGREIVDALFFWLNLVNAAEFPSDQIEQWYKEKHERNMARYANGPDGYSMVEGKCANCKQDFGDLDAMHAADLAYMSPAEWLAVAPGERYSLVIKGNAYKLCSRKCAEEFSP